MKSDFPDFRSDELTGSGNLLAFIDSLQQQFGLPASEPYSLVCLAINNPAILDHINRDSALRWAALVLAEEAGGTVFRIGAAEFVLVMTEGLHSEHSVLAQHIFNRLNTEAERFGMPAPAASIALLHYNSPDEFSPGRVISQIEAAILQVKPPENRSFKAYAAADYAMLKLEIGAALVDRLIQLSSMLSESNQMAYVDPMTGLPNLRAARRQLDLNVSLAVPESHPFSVLLIDGDALRAYNQISYAAGDEMILKLSNLIKQQLRPGDYMARWRTGDEFMVQLPATDLSGALVVGRRLCSLVQAVSRNWLLPVTVSIGIAVYPEHGSTVAELLDQAESANFQAKLLGKNRVVIAS